MIFEALNKLIDYAEKNGLTERADGYVIRNMLMQRLNLSDWENESGIWRGEEIDRLLAPIIDYAVENGVIVDTSNSRDLFDTAIMGIFTPMPREVRAKFLENTQFLPRKQPIGILNSASS